ncbi:recQ-mediated genome instability protein 1-like isoform X2 [Watersipora subatra]|uniref:recQ-mediated genome instability protein 1-like isoform X2 n=1 Tax=Watersipora subatra TaxID=2589382 RepID=UPI00355BC97C
MDEAAIHQWLSRKHISVPLQWVRECVQFLRMEVNYAVDISKSMYSQMRSLLGRNVGNLEVQEMEEPGAKWGPKASRCMMLEITDGVRRIKAVEQEAIAALNYAWNPGTKVLLNGPIRCVENCLMLTNGSITILGGLVEELTEKFNSEKILQEILIQSTAANKENCSKRFLNPGKIRANNHDSKVEMKHHKSEYKQPICTSEWEEDMSDSEFLDCRQTGPGDCSFNSDWLSSEPSVIHPKHNSTEIGQHAEGFDALTWSDDELVEGADKPKSMPQHQLLSRSTLKHDEGACNFNNESMVWSDTDDIDILDGDVIKNQGESPPKATLQNNNLSSVNMKRGISESTFSHTDQIKDSCPRVNPEKLSNSVIDLLSSSSDDDEPFNTTSLQKNQQTVTSGPPLNPQPMLAQSKPQHSIMTNSSGEAGMADTTYATFRDECCESHRCQFHYLSQLSPSSNLKTIVIKAHVSTVLDKLGRSADKTRWTLNVRINDGTSFLDCLISHQLIESHIGRVRETLKKSKANITDKRIVVQKMKNFADRLAAANGMMHVDVTDSARPVLLDIRQPTQNDVRLFQMCLARN